MISEAQTEYAAMTPDRPGEWVVIALRDRFGNVWDIIQNTKYVQLRTAQRVQMKRAQAEIDYGPLRACEVNDIEGLIRDYQIKKESLARSWERCDEIGRQLAILKVEQSENHAVEGGTGEPE